MPHHRKSVQSYNNFLKHARKSYFFSLFSAIICAREIFFVILCANLRIINDQIFNIMKKSILVLTAAVAIVFASCNEKPYINEPGDNGNNYPEIPVLVPDTNGIEISVDSAIAICNALEDNAVTAEVYKLRGTILAVTTNVDDVPSKYTNINFTLSDNGGKTSIACYYTNYINNIPFRNKNQIPAAGSVVAVQGPLTKYYNSSKGTRTPELKNGFIVHIDYTPAPPDTIKATCAEAKAVIASMADNETTTDIYVIEGYVQSDGYDGTISHGQQKFMWLDDAQSGTKVVQGYYCNVPNEIAVPVGTKVRMTGKITKYNNTPEVKNGDVVIIE